MPVHRLLLKPVSFSGGMIAVLFRLSFWPSRPVEAELALGLVEVLWPDFQRSRFGFLDPLGFSAGSVGPRASQKNQSHYDENFYYYQVGEAQGPTDPALNPNGSRKPKRDR